MVVQPKIARRRASANMGLGLAPSAGAPNKPTKGSSEVPSVRCAASEVSNAAGHAVWG